MSGTGASFSVQGMRCCSAGSSLTDNTRPCPGSPRALLYRAHKVYSTNSLAEVDIPGYMLQLRHADTTVEIMEIASEDSFTSRTCQRSSHGMRRGSSMLKIRLSAPPRLQVQLAAVSLLTDRCAVVPALPVHHDRSCYTNCWSTLLSLVLTRIRKRETLTMSA